MSGMYGTTRGFMPRQAQRPTQNQPPGVAPTPPVAPYMNMQQPQMAQQSRAHPVQQVGQMAAGPMPQGGMAGTNANRVAGLLNSTPDNGGVVAGNQMAPAAQAPGLPPGIDLNDPRNAALAGYMAQ